MNKITLATLPQATAQEVFDHVLNHSRNQKMKSLIPGTENTCAYRNENGLACFAGCMISDEEYNHLKSYILPTNDWQGDLGIEDVLWVYLADKGIVPKEHETLIQSLQMVHDSKELSEWEANFARIANSCNLIYTPPVAQ